MPRMPEEGEDITGKVCVCSIGRAFIVTGRGEIDNLNGMFWVGLGLDGHGNVASSNPCILAESGEEFHNRLRDRFDGKPRYHGD